MYRGTLCLDEIGITWKLSQKMKKKKTHLYNVKLNRNDEKKHNWMLNYKFLFFFSI